MGIDIINNFAKARLKKNSLFYYLFSAKIPIFCEVGTTNKNENCHLTIFMQSISYGSHNP